jgi:hypothetical protein
MSRPETITLSAAEGEAIIARLSVYAPSGSDCEILIQVLRWYFWLAAALQEAKLGSVAKFDFWAKSKNLVSGIQ